MAKGVASPTSTGGEGFSFEDKVSAWFLAHMFSDEPPFDIGGRIERVDFQARPEGWFIDDLLLTLHDDPPRQIALSIKSNTQFTKDAAPTDFVEIAWELFLGENSLAFTRSTDLMGLITSPLLPEMRQAIEFVLSSARTGDPSTLPSRYQADGWANDIKRALFRSFACPEALAHKHGITEVDIGRMLAHLRFLQFDFKSTPSESEKMAIARCRAALRSGDVQEAAQLWEHLLYISADLRPNAGTLDVLGLIDDIRHHFELMEVPNYSDDWSRLAHLAASGLAEGRDSIGGLVQLERDGEVKKLTNALTAAGGVVLLGPSGAGKSMIAMNLSRAVAKKDRVCLWFGATSFEQQSFASFQADLELTHPLRELLRSARGGQALLILDGLDRLYDGGAFTLLGSLFESFDLSREGTPWRVVITCQTQEWPRLQQSLLSVGAPVSTWHVIECDPVRFEALEPVWAAIPSAARLQHQANLRPLLTNLKILDLIVSRLAACDQMDTDAWIGESNVANWFWQSQVATGTDRWARERFAMLLAERQADELELTLPLDRFVVAELTPLGQLEADGVCVRTDRGRVGFTHDLFSDWARLQILIGHSDDIARFLEERMKFPLWHRATRLFGTHLLEHPSDLAQWRALVTDSDTESKQGVCDLLLDSIIFAANPSALLEQVCEDLKQNDGRLLRRLLGRFLAFATLPDPYYLALAQTEGIGTEDVAALYRYPNWLYWPSVLKFLHERRTELLRLAPIEIARIVDLWLKHTAPGFPFRRGIAEIALLLGQRARESQRAYCTADYKQHKLYYRVALLAADEIPDEVSAFALEASERMADEEEDEGETGDTALGEHPEPKLILFDPRYDSDKPTPESWPDGPRRQVVDDFQEAVLEPAALLPLVRTRPSVAREVLLASLIKARDRFDELNSWHESRKLDIEGGLRWIPPLYIDGPFLGFLKADFREGLEVIARLVDFASERWRHHTGLEASELHPEMTAHGEDKSLFGNMVSEWRRPPGSVLLSSDNGDSDLVGDSRVFGWSAGLGNPPNAIEAALMAIEQYFYLELNENRPVDDKVRMVLERAHSTAFLKPLCDVGKRKPDLFRGPLRSLLAIPEIYEWDIQATAQGRQHLLIGALMRGRWFAKLAQDFHDQEYRSIDLRCLGVDLFLADEGVRTYLSAVRQHWEQRLADTPVGPSHDFLRQLIVGYDIENYRVVEDSEHGHAICNIRARELFEERAEERKQLEDESFLVFMPIRCRKMLDERTVLQQADLDEFWNQIEQLGGRYQEIDVVADVHDQDEVTEQPVETGSSSLARMKRVFSRLAYLFRRTPQEQGSGNWKQPSVETTPPEYDKVRDHLVNALTGAAAVLIRNHGDWLAQHPDRKEWCRDILRESVLDPPLRDRIDVPESVSDWTWDCFAAEALPVLWADDVRDEELRHLIARVVFAPHNVAVKILLARCAERRGELGEDFGRLRRLVFELAHIRNRGSFVQQARQYHCSLTEEAVSHFREAANVWVQNSIEEFVDGSLPLPTKDWKEMDRPDRFEIVDDARTKSFRNYFLDFHLVRAAHEWLPPISEAIDERERQEWLEFLRSSLSFSLSRVNDDEDRTSHPCEDDHWVLDRVSAALPMMRSEERPDEIWLGVLNLGHRAHYWAEDFLQAFHWQALLRDEVPACFSPLRLAIIEYALADERDGKGLSWSTNEEVWQALVGVDGLTRSNWTKRHQPIAAASESLLERWTDRVGTNGRHLSALAAWLKTEAAVPLRLHGLSWLDHALKKSETERLFHNENPEDAIASLLQVIWRTDEARLRGDAVAFGAFRSLLSRLASLQNLVALELVGHLGGLSS